MIDEATDSRDLMRALVLNDLNIAGSVQSVEAAARKLREGIQRGMGCYDAEKCAGKVCGECGK